MKTLTAFFILLLCIKVHAYPEMVRHHYVNCTACHVSQTGGGVLNSYGRTISQELLSTWGKGNEGRAFYAVDPESLGQYLHLGGGIRGMQSYFENETVKSARAFVMQAAVEAALTLKEWTGFMSFGQVRTQDNTFRDVSTRYFLSYQVNDEFSVRAGRTSPVFGLNIPQHNFLVKSNLALGPGTERDTLEAFYNGENYSVGFSAAQSLHASAVRDEEKSLSVKVDRYISDSHKVGLSAWSGDATGYKKHMIGLHGVLGLTEAFYLLTEVDHLFVTPKSTGIEKKSLYELLKIGYEVHKGLHAQIVQQYGKPDFNRVSSEVQSLGAGFIWYPRPHFEFEFLYSQQKTLGGLTGVDQADTAYLLGHFYF